MKILVWFFLLCGWVCGAEVTEEAVDYAGVKFRVVRVEPQRVRLLWGDKEGKPYRTVDKVQAAVEAEGKTLKFLMNAGIFEMGGAPSGMAVTDGKLSRAVNLAPGDGNFFLKPNGVVSFGTGVYAKAAVRESYCMQATVENVRAKREKGDLAWAVQSGPMLLQKGKRHPSFREKSTSLKHRNGVGVDKDGKLVFAMTADQQVVNFWNFAGLFLELGCQDALFLDGDLSVMEVNPGKLEAGTPLGAMFVVAE